MYDFLVVIIMVKDDDNIYYIFVFVDDGDYEEEENDYDETFCSQHLHSPPHLWPLPPLLLPLPGNTIIIMVVVVVVVMVMVDGDEGGGDGGGEKDEDWSKFAIIFNDITQQHHPYSHHHQHNFCHLNLGRGRAVLVRGSTSIITKHVFPGCDTLSTLHCIALHCCDFGCDFYDVSDVFPGCEKTIHCENWFWLGCLWCICWYFWVIFTNPNNNLMMRRAGLSAQIQTW